MAKLQRPYCRNSKTLSRQALQDWPEIWHSHHCDFCLLSVPVVCLFCVFWDSWRSPGAGECRRRWDLPKTVVGLVSSRERPGPAASQDLSRLFKIFQDLWNVWLETGSSENVPVECRSAVKCWKLAETEIITEFVQDRLSPGICDKQLRPRVALDEPWREVCH